MEQLTKEQILQRIEREILKTVDIIAEYKEMTKPISPENAIGRLSRMDAINNKAVTESALRQAEEKLDKLKFVRTKIDDADFGICKKCKCTIPIGRIILMPHSFYCVSCAK
jgi:DnaK suppressor protein